MTDRPQQARSRTTERAIVDAMAALLSEKPYADIAVSEIAQRAGVSIGGLYARFPSKAQLLEMVELNRLAELEEQAVARLSTIRGDIADIAREYALLLVESFRDNRSDFLQILKYAGAHETVQTRLTRINRHIHGVMHEMLRAHADVQSINMALFFAGAAARAGVLAGDLATYPVSLDDRGLAMEIARAFEAYLRAAAEKSELVV